MLPSPAAKGARAPRRPHISQSAVPGDARLTALEDWLDGIDAVRGLEPRPASEDASFRRYFRLGKGRKTWIAMDAPPPQEDCRPFVAVARHLAAMQLNAPRILEADLERGFLLMTDLGSTQYLDALEHHPENADGLYDDALDALACMQQRGTVMQTELPPYDEKLLRFELSLFHDWLCGTHLGIELDRREASRWQMLCDLLVENAFDQPRVYVHRDYHSRNLMVTERDNPGILDFQDAVEGPLTYDLVSLLKDCYIRWPDADIDRRMHAFYDRLQASMQARIGRNTFVRCFDLMGVQRHIKAAGIFARLKHRDGKHAYVEDVPRVLSYIVDLSARYDELAFLVELITTRMLPGLEGQR